MPHRSLGYAKKKKIMERPLANQPFETLWKILFLILMELGARSGIVSQQDDEVEPHEQGEEEDIDNDPEIEEQHESDEEHDQDGSDTSEVSPAAIPREPEEELNPNNVGDVNTTPDEPLPTHTADTHAMETGLDGAGNFHASEEVVPESDHPPAHDAADMDEVEAQDSDLFGENQLYDPFSRPEGEVVVQVFPVSRSPSRGAHCKRHRSV